MPASVTIRVPGSTSNIGPGFDCLGIALALHNELTVTRTDGPLSVSPAFGVLCASPMASTTMVLPAVSPRRHTWLAPVAASAPAFAETLSVTVTKPDHADH